MSDREKKRRNTHCSFCGKGQDQVSRLVAGPGVYICDACVGLCNEILAESGPRPDPPACQPPADRGRRRWLPNVFRAAPAR
jgi:hypothetical protein